MEYLSFDLRLGEWDPAAKTGVAEVLQSPAGEGRRHSFALHLDIARASSRAEHTPANAIALGQALADCALAQDSLALWRDSYQIARERDRRLRLRLQIDSWELSRLPWELLYDTRHGEFLVFDQRVSVVRYLRLQAMPPTLRQGKSLKVLVAAAAPRDQAQLDWEREQKVLNDALRELVAAGQIAVIHCEHATHEKLQSVLLENAPDVVHFIGHGEYDQEQRIGRLLLESEAGLSDPMGAPDVARLLRRYGANLVVLNACETAQGAWAGLAPALVRAEIPAVVAMQWAVEDRAAIRFSRAFYRALAMGRTLDECVSEGRVGASAANADPNDWAAPVLFLRSASGRLWTSDIAKSRGRAQARPLAGQAVEMRPAAAAPEAFSFKTRGPLLSSSDADLIIDRPELRRALRLAQQPSVTQYIAFLSARQTGKTTLLLRMMDMLRDQYACIFVDLAVLRAQDTRACFRFVAFRLISELREWLSDDFLAAGPQVENIENSVDFTEFLRALADALSAPRIILMLDEVGALAPQVSDSFFNALRTVFTQGRGLNTQLAKYLFVFSGAVDLYSLTYGTNSPLNICEKLYLQDFDVADTQHIVRQFERLNVQVPDEAASHIHGLAGGHPYLTMRLCALLEHAQVTTLTPEAIDRAAQQMLIEDDNIRHVIIELERRPAERRKLRSILIEGRETPFSRNDPVLASLEMIGAIRASQPCQVRNQLYERALRQYYAASERQAPAPIAAAEPAEDIAVSYARLQALRNEALDASGNYQRGKAWESFAAALFSLVPSFCVYPVVHTDTEQLDVVLAINGDAPGGAHWSIYAPAILVECRNLQDSTPQSMIAELVGKASLHNIRLVFVMTSGGTTSAAEQQARYSGARGDTCIVLIDDAEIAPLLDERGDLDAFLRNKVFEARLRRI